MNVFCATAAAASVVGVVHMAEYHLFFYSLMKYKWNVKCKWNVYIIILIFGFLQVKQNKNK